MSMKTPAFTFISVAVMVAVLTSSGCTSILTEQVCIRETCFAVDLADTPQAREHGLMGVERLGENEGMVFVFESEGSYTFWMKDTLIPLDMIWIGRDGRVIYVQKDAQPCTADPCAVYGPPAGSRALYVLEVPGGTAERLGIAAGDEVTLRI